MSERLLTPQQEAFLSYYTNPKSDTFSNAKQSAIKAGYSDSYADSITDFMPDWLWESMGDMQKLRRAEKNLTEVQNLPIIDEQGKVDTNLLDKRTKVDMFIAERLGKHKYSTRQELTGKDGEKLEISVVKYEDNDTTPNKEKGQPNFGGNYWTTC